MVEPLEVKTTDAFRAAVKKDAPETPNELPAVAAADKGKYLHTNESTGALEWAEGGSGGGVIVVHDVDGTLDKTWQEIRDAFVSGGVRIVKEDEYGAEFVVIVIGTESGDDSGGWAVYTSKTGNWHPQPYATNSADGYPTISK